MKLQGILHEIQSLKEYGQIKKGLVGGKAYSASLLSSAQPAFAAALSLDLNRPLLIVTASPEGARKRAEQLRVWCPENIPVMPFPEPDSLPFERILPDPSTTHDRIKALFRLADCNAAGAGFKHAHPKGVCKTRPCNKEIFDSPIVVASSSALLSRTPVYESFKESIYYIYPGMKASPLLLLEKFQKLGYNLEIKTELPGNMSHRGGIIDIFPTHLENPVRIDFIGNEIESLRFFNPVTQRSISEIEGLTVSLARDMAPVKQGESLDSILSFLDMGTCSEETVMLFKEELSLILNGIYRPGLEFYSPIFNEGSILDFLPPGSLLVLEEPHDIYQVQEKLELESRSLKEIRIQQGEIPSNFPSTYIPAVEMRQKIDRYEPSLILSVLPEAGSLVLPFTRAPSLVQRFPVSFGDREETLPVTFGKELNPEEGKTVVIISPQAKRISEILEEGDILARPQEELAEPPQSGNLYLLQGFAEEGWSLKIEDSGSLVLFTDREIFGTLKQRRLLKKHRAGLKLFLPSLQPGDYVVHVDHGLARFKRIIRKNIGDVEREYLELEYAFEDKLYVPVNQLDRLSRYVGTSAESPKLTRLGTKEWHRTKGRAKEAAREIAGDLVEIYAARELAQGLAFSPDMPWQREMEDSFIYEETPDQLKATFEVKQDMEKPRPMDRLICGDVGYGKTEVAVRAAFKAVMDGKQVAVLVPTTILAQQHYYTFQERLKAFPIRIEVLSRFKSPKEQQNIVQGLKEGSVDICIGTHRLLQKDVSFKDLGLVIIDEEQRFGVMHKERLKKLRKEVDVLTLSATPIPRTLHLALLGLRDTSIMETPPEERLPIKTFVAEFDDRLVREAIIRELERGGQVFFLHNRVKTISRMASKVQALVPEARIIVAHGQMPEEQLEDAMLEFTSGESDVLVCTTIIESGLDLPRANTLLVNDADKLGLTQLYHLRGRIGRGNIQAYAYFLYQPSKTLSINANKRLQTIYEATELGSGFRIAMADLEIRGAGNILGKEQSGQIDAVGFELYTQILSEAVNELRAGIKDFTELEKKVTKELPGPSEICIDLPIPFYIPRDYIGEEKTRLEIYMRLSRIKDMEALRDIEEEIRDRFGAPPSPLTNILLGIRLKLLAAKAEVSSMSLDGQTIVLRSEKDLKNLLNSEALYWKYGNIINVGNRQLRLNISQVKDSWLKVLEELLILMNSPDESGLLICI